jgi:hypothetical protein
MSMSAIPGASAYASNLQAQGPTPHKHGRHQAQSISDVDQQSSSVTNAPSSTGKAGSKVDITA